MPFETGFTATWLAKRRWRLTAPLVYKGRWELFVVPEGFTTDLASVPRAFWVLLPPDGRYTRAAVLHDWLYTTRLTTRRHADGVFRRVMKEEGVGWLTRRTIWAAVRIGGRWAWRSAKRS